VVLDTNVFVAASFRPRSGSARILDRVRRGDLPMVWSEATRRETRRILRKIPPLAWDAVADLFRDEDGLDGEPDAGDLDHIPDPTDRKFAAVARAAGAVLVSADHDLLGSRDSGEVTILSPAEFLNRED